MASEGTNASTHDVPLGSTTPIPTSSPPPYCALDSQHTSQAAAMEKQEVPVVGELNSHNQSLTTYPHENVYPTSSNHNAHFVPPMIVQGYPNPVHCQPATISSNGHRNELEVPDEMACSILNTLCCCFYLGIPAIILASQANRLRHTDPERAYSKARAARILNVISVILGIVIIVLIVVLQWSNYNSYY